MVHNLPNGPTILRHPGIETGLIQAFKGAFELLRARRISC
jgi:hypothetical protein